MHLWWIRNSRVVNLRCSFAAMTMVRKRRSDRSWISLDGKQRTWEELRERVQSNRCACCGASPASYITTGPMLSSCSRKVESSVDALTCDEPPATADFPASMFKTRYSDDSNLLKQRSARPCSESSRFGTPASNESQCGGG